MLNMLVFLTRLPLFIAGVTFVTLVGVPLAFVLGTGYLIINLAWLIIVSPLLLLGVAVRQELRHLGEYFRDACDLLAGPRQCLELLSTVYASMINWVAEAKS